MSRRGVDAMFQAFFLLTDIRALYRLTAPMHQLDETQKAEAAKIIEKLKKQVGSLEEEVLK
ncbi:hypothetical protein [Methanolacinia petrolearia]|uniref:hypothetical protein n=1 Tax=Methanolacinia petrolearia TaxID=54120 RepID=UPI003BAA71E8